MATHHFKNLRHALRWRNRHKHQTVTGVTVTSHQPPIAPQKHHPLTLSERIVAQCHHALEYAGNMTYTENLKARQELFHRSIGAYAGACADCSQFGSAILHWLGVAKAASTDATGAMLDKYQHHVNPAAGRGVVFGAAPGEHFAFVTAKTPDGKDWYVVGFGHQGAPDRSTLSGMKTYFKERGHPGVTFLSFD